MAIGYEADVVMRAEELEFIKFSIFLLNIFWKLGQMSWSVTKN